LAETLLSSYAFQSMSDTISMDRCFIQKFFSLMRCMPMSFSQGLNVWWSLQSEILL